MTRVRSFMTRLLAACLVTVFTSPAFAGEHLTMGIISPRSPALNRPAYQPLADEIGRVLDGATIELDPVMTYQEGLKRMEARKWDLAFATDYTYLQIKPLGFRSLVRVTENGKSQYRAAILVRKDSPYRRLEDLKGHRIAFTATESVSGFIYPAKMLKDAGLHRTSALARKHHGGQYTPLYLGNARRITSGLANPTAKTSFEAGCVFEGALTNFSADAPYLRVLATSDMIPHIPVIAAPRVLNHGDWPERLTRLLLAMTPQSHPQVFADQPTIFFDGFASPDDRPYDHVKQILLELE